MPPPAFAVFGWHVDPTTANAYATGRPEVGVSDRPALTVFGWHIDPIIASVSAAGNAMVGMSGVPTRGLL